MGHQLASILVGDHLGQVKKVLWPSGEVSLLPDFSQPDSSNPVVSIETIDNKTGRQLISNKKGDLYIYDPIKGEVKQCNIKGNDSLISALPLGDHGMAFVHEKYILLEHTNKNKSNEIKLKKGQIKAAKACDGSLAIVGKDIPLKVFDVKTSNKIFEADLPEKDWLGIRPDCDVASLDFVGQHRVVTSSKSDSVIRVYDIKSNKTCPIITIDLNQTAFNEYAEAGRFLSVASATCDQSSPIGTVAVGSNVGQLIAIELRFRQNKLMPKKKLQPKTYKVLGGFKGSRGATIKDIKIIEAESGEKADYKVISCCLDRYLRIHDMSKKSGRYLDKQVYMKTKPLCCSPIFYQNH